MDEIKGTLKDFTGATTTMEVGEQTYVLIFLKQLWNANGMITGDEISVIYEVSSLTKDTSTVKALKVVDDFHKSISWKYKKRPMGSTGV